jgi:hypothetical protein
VITDSTPVDPARRAAPERAGRCARGRPRRGRAGGWLAASREPSGPPALAADPRAEGLRADRQEGGQAGVAEPRRHAGRAPVLGPGPTTAAPARAAPVAHVRRPRRGRGVIDHRRPAAGVTGPPGGIADESPVAVRVARPSSLQVAGSRRATDLCRVREHEGREDENQGGGRHRGEQHRRCLHIEGSTRPPSGGSPRVHPWGGAAGPRRR